MNMESIENNTGDTFDRTIETNKLDRNDPQVKNSIAQAEAIVRHAKIKLNTLEGALDPRIISYVLLRSGVMPEGVKYDRQISDQRIFGEVLKMYNDADSLDKLIKAYPNISFDYKSKASPASS